MSTEKLCFYLRRSVLQDQCSSGERLKVQIFPHTLPGRCWVARSSSATLCFIFLTEKKIWTYIKHKTPKESLYLASHCSWQWRVEHFSLYFLFFYIFLLPVSRVGSQIYTVTTMWLVSYNDRSSNKIILFLKDIHDIRTAVSAKQNYIEKTALSASKRFDLVEKWKALTWKYIEKTKIHLFNVFLCPNVGQLKQRWVFSLFFWAK